MSEEFKGLFSESNLVASAANHRGLSGTEALNAMASGIASEVIKTLNESTQHYSAEIAASQHNASAMDKLVESIYNINAVADVEALKACDEVTLEAMLKSQQSKRSRLKSKIMTMDNYRSMITAAAAELLLRKVMGKSKGEAHYGKSSALTEYTQEALDKLALDQEALRKEIRNLQSKKSIYKSKAEFDETSDRWVMLCAMEDQLKSMRTGTAPVVEKVVEVDTTKNALADALGDIDIEHMKSADSKELLKKLAGLLNVKEDAE